MLFERYYFDVFLVKIVVLAKVADSEEGPYRLLKNDPHPALLYISFYVPLLLLFDHRAT